MLGILIFIAVLQSITEFLPVSSSGHLALASKILSFNSPDMLLYFLVVHTGTAFSALYFFREDILSILNGLLDVLAKKNTERGKDALKWVGLIFVVSVPTAIVGLNFKSFIEGIGENTPVIIPISLIITAFLLMATKWAKPRNLGLHEFSYPKAFCVGLAQSFALLPGISRSGSTISVALLFGASSNFAGRLSFLASFVAIFGALLLETISTVKEGTIAMPIYYFVIGLLVSFFMGLWALKFLIKILSHGKMYLFSLYCFTVGLVFLILFLN